MKLKFIVLANPERVEYQQPPVATGGIDISRDLNPKGVELFRYRV